MGIWLRLLDNFALTYIIWGRNMNPIKGEGRMKKYFFVLISLILTLSLFISCDNSNKAPINSEVVVLDFTEISNSRGITGFPNYSPFNHIIDADTPLVNDQGDGMYYDGTKYGFWMNCNVMRSLPILPGLKSANANADDYVESIKLRCPQL